MHHIKSNPMLVILPGTIVDCSSLQARRCSKASVNEKKTWPRLTGATGDVQVQSFSTAYGLTTRKSLDRTMTEASD